MWMTWIAIIGTVLTAIGTTVTLIQARRVRRYREQIAFDLRKIRLSEVAGHLRRAQDEGRKLIAPIQKKLRRGIDDLTIVSDIQFSIDSALGLIALVGSDADIRDTILKAQEALRNYQDPASTETSKEKNIQKHYRLIQDAISMCRGRIVKLEVEAR